MKILFTGASSFTGYWFVRELTATGHTVTATFRKRLDEYSGIRQTRVTKLLPLCKPLFQCPFGSESFLKTIEQESHWDILCHHAADVTDYKSPAFDAAAALAANTKNLLSVLESLKKKRCHTIILTGSIFEPNEGTGPDPRAFSPYGLSKGMTSEYFRYYAEILGLKLAKFVIPNPFGPYEEERFTTFLAQSWMQGKVPEVSMPAYVRDNIHVSYLAKAYVNFLTRMNPLHKYEKCGPSQYPESQGSFVKRFAQEMEKRWNTPCLFVLKEQKEFPEPVVRINTDRLDIPWDEKTSWDALADYFRNKK